MRDQLRTFFIGMLAVVLALGAASALAAEPVPTSVFIRKPEFVAAKISPGGEFLAVTTPGKDQTGLGIIDLSSRKVTAAFQFGHGEHVADVHWVSRERVVIELARRGGWLDQPRRTGELFAINADGSNKKYLFGYRGEEQVGSHLKKATKAYAWAMVVDPMLEDPHHALVLIEPFASQELKDPLLKRIDVRNGGLSNVGMIPARAPMDAIADRQGRPRMAYGTDEGGELRLMTRDEDGGLWKTVRLPDGAPEFVWLHHVHPDGRSAFLTAASKAGRSCLFRYEFESANLKELLCRQGSLGDVLFSVDETRVIGIAREDGLPRVEFVDPGDPDAMVLKGLQAAFPDQRVRIASHSRDGRRLAIVVDSDRNPGEFYLFDRSGNKVEYLFASREWVDAKRMAGVEAVSYKARDGLRIPAFLTRPKNAGGKLPLVVMPHGGPHAVFDIWRWDDWAQFLASRGYAVLQPNYRGSGGYGMAFQRAGYRKWGTTMQDDLTDGVRWAASEGIVDPTRVCILGASYGGYAALMSTTREPDLYRCAVAFAGVYDLESQLADSDTRNFLAGRVHLEEALGSDPKELAENSPVTHIKRLKVPVLIAHGTNDARVPFSQAELLRDALEKHGKPFEWLAFAGEEHGFYEDENHQRFLDRLATFLHKHIGGTPASAP